MKSIFEQQLTMEFPGYLILSQTYESANSAVYRARRELDNQTVILKVLKEDYPTLAELTRYKQEYEITRSLNIDGVIKAYGLEPYQRTLVIILEDFGGFSLKQGLLESSANFSLAEFLKIAIQTAEILGQIHSSNVIHKDINPANIVLNSETGQVKIIDFGISTQLNRENPTVKNPNVLEGTLAYMSPEQTGRMNRALDYRTDFYSLGVTFYELLTGKLPYETKDALELVHCHIAKVPISPYEVNSEIPQTVSEIVMKLMAKTVEDRYQSAWGIKADLEKCLDRLQAKGEISEFPLGAEDISDKFHIPQKLYGREAEVETLLAAFERVADNPQSQIEMMLVAGYSGIGKSSLVAEIHKPNTRLRGYFTEGKFDQFQRNIPYSAIVSAFKGLMGQLLTESEAQLTQWREKLLAALGNNAQVIIDVIPEVELIVGKQPPVPELGPTESQNRFNRVFGQFIRAFCTKEHPLVIFLDDLQWADSATLKLIELMMMDSETEYLFLIGAYRDNEVSPTHPLMMTLEGLQKQGAVVNSITLAPLALEHIGKLIADTLHGDAATVQPLAQLVKRKTGGNPFFANQFLKTLHSEHLVAFDFKRHVFIWDISEIEAQDITDNVVELTIGRLKKLPESTQQVLRLAACIGAYFDLTTSSIICEQSKEEVFPDLVTAIQSGFILPKSELDTELLIQDYKFLHDRVQQAAYALIDDAQKTAVHLKIGRLLLQNTAPEALSEEIFEIVDHLNLGVELVSDRAELEKISRLNLMAGKKAKSATAYAASVTYFQVGRELLSADCWQNSYDLALSLYEEAAEAAYLCGDFTAMQELAEAVKNSAKTIVEKVKVYDVEIQAAGSQGKLIESLKIGLNVLEQLGFPLPENPSQLDIQKGLDETASLLQGREIEELIDLPEMTSPEALAAMFILASTLAAAYIANSELFIMNACTQVNLSIKYGSTTWSASGYSCYAIYLCWIGEDIESGYKFGKLALNLQERLNAEKVKSKVFEIFGAHVMHWKKHFKETLPFVIEGYQSGIETGDFEFAGYCACYVCNHSYFIGGELTEVERQMTTYSHAIAQIRRDSPFNWTALFWQAVLNLLGRSENPIRLIGDAFNEEESLPDGDRTRLHFFYLNKLMLCYLFDEKHQAVENAVAAEEYLDGVKAMIVESPFNFYDSLAHLGVFGDLSNSEKQAFLDRVDKNQEKMGRWARHAPMNHLHKFNLVEAEKARVLGQLFEAEEFYEQAIAGARENQFIQEEALAYELAAKFYLERGREKFAQTYMKEARYAYTRWGAKAKVEDLERKYSQLLPKSSSTKSITSTSTTTIESTSGSQSVSVLDFATVMKASQAISGEIRLDKLLTTLIAIILENTGAQSGFLLLETKGELFIEAEALANGEVTVLQARPMEFVKPDGETPLLSSAIVNYVVRTRKSLVLDNAAREGNFTNEGYIKKYGVKSVLCVPLLHRGQLNGIVYLENNLTTGAFTPDRLEVLQLLSGQAAIAIDNARLYSQLEDYSHTLEQKVEKRTAQLAEATREAKAANEAKSTFLANMSHELRTPLNAILGFSQLLTRSQTLGREHQENVGIISRSGEHLLTLINQVLDLSKIEAGRVTLNPDNFDLYRLLDDIEDLLGLKASQKGLQLVCEREPDTPRYINTDEMKLRQVLINLINNAIKFTAEGGVEVRVRQKADNSPSVELEFDVTDSGAGIAPEELDSLFEAFVQTETGKQSQEGTGLGLPISRKFVQLMGGDIAVASRLGGGTTFKFNIQATTAEEADVESKKPTRRAIALAPNQPRYRILVVDDKPINCQLLIKLLLPFGFDVKEASNGREAVDIYLKWQPDLIFMDMRMPVMDGYEATRQIKAAAGSKPCAVVAVTASILEEEKAVVLEAGCDDFIRKPFKDGEILEAIARHLGAEFIYEDLGETAQDREEALTAGALAAVPQELLAALEEGLLTLDLEEIQEAIIAIASYVPVVARQLESLVNSFAYQEILDLIEESKSMGASGILN